MSRGWVVGGMTFACTLACGGTVGAEGVVETEPTVMAPESPAPEPPDAEPEPEADARFTCCSYVEDGLPLFDIADDEEQCRAQHGGEAVFLRGAPCVPTCCGGLDRNDQMPAGMCEAMGGHAIDADLCTYDPDHPDE